MGPFPLGKKQLRFLIVTVDYFTKWLEAKPVTTIIEAKITSFVWKNIICGFGVHASSYSTMESNLTIPSFENFAKT